jgi:hypothetical protein
MKTQETTTSNTGRVPTPTSARVELPTQAAVDAAGITLDLAEARLVLSVLSGMIGRATRRAATRSAR